MNKDNIIKLLETIIHPAKDKDIVSLGMVEDVDISADKIKFKLIFPGRDPLSESLKKRCEDLIQSNYPDYKVSILEMIREKKQNKALMVEESFEAISGVGKIIAVASGKGGVGKSTVAVNLAVTLAQMGYKVGLADADVYGPSVAKMTDTEGSVPEVIMKDGGSENGGTDLIVPIERYGVKWMSIGYFARPEQALIWRGPMACNALKQMILQVEWGELDFLLLDLPPGTGDIHIALVHDIPLAGAIIVSTPQAVALADVEKGVNLFRNKNVVAMPQPQQIQINQFSVLLRICPGLLQKSYQITNITSLVRVVERRWQTNIKFLFLDKFQLFKELWREEIVDSLLF